MEQTTRRPLRGDKNGWSSFVLIIGKGKGIWAFQRGGTRGFISFLLSSVLVLLGYLMAGSERAALFLLCDTPSELV